MVRVVWDTWHCEGWENANSHVPCRAPAMPGRAPAMPCRAPAMPCRAPAMPCRTHAFFPQCRVLCEISRGSRKYQKCYSYSLTDWYASDNLRGTPRGGRKKPTAVRSAKRRLWTSDANSHMPCHAHAALYRGLEKSVSERHGRGMERARRGGGMAWHV
jgi:hypothetical protein